MCKKLIETFIFMVTLGNNSTPGHVLECSQVTVTGLWGRMGHKHAENP